MFDNADDAFARTQEDLRRAQQRAERLPLLQAATEAARGMATTRQRDIAIEVDAAGQILDLKISDQAFNRGSSRLAAEIVDLFNQARQNVQTHILAAATEVLGEDDPIIDRFRQTVEAEAETEDGVVVRVPRMGVRS